MKSGEDQMEILDRGSGDDIAGKPTPEVGSSDSQIRLNTFLIRMSCHGKAWAILKIQSSLDLGHYVSNVRQL
jgi:hypothetical protein